MGNVQRICEQCGEGGPLEARYCPHCGNDNQATLPTPTRNLPMVIGKAALPLLAGAASLALRAGWKFLQHRLATAATTAPLPLAQTTPAPPAQQPAGPTTRPRRTVRIRSTWAVGDANGVWQQGTSDQTIEIED